MAILLSGLHLLFTDLTGSLAIDSIMTPPRGFQMVYSLLTKLNSAQYLLDADAVNVKDVQTIDRPSSRA